MGCIKTMHLVMVGWTWLTLCYGLKLFLFATNACYKCSLRPEKNKFQFPLCYGEMLVEISEMYNAYGASTNYIWELLQLIFRNIGHF